MYIVKTLMLLIINEVCMLCVHHVFVVHIILLSIFASETKSNGIALQVVMVLC